MIIAFKRTEETLEHCLIVLASILIIIPLSEIKITSSSKLTLVSEATLPYFSV